ncbi:MAG TPA: radical SAM protein [bacterium]|nr:radical SAM protein [bacterium]HPN94374.1 radical SAM protein [bacterium]
MAPGVEPERASFHKMLSYRLAKNTLEALLRGRAGAPAPILCSFLATSKCNLKCDGCSFMETFAKNGSPMNGEGDMSSAEAMRLVTEPAMRKLPALIFAGGEPLEREDIFDLARAALPQFIILLTNGTLIDDRIARQIDSSFDMCVVSIDGVREDNDIIRGSGSYEMATRGVAALVQARKRSKISVACVINRHNVERLAEFACDMRELGADSVKFQLNFLERLQPSPEQARKGFASLAYFCDRNPGFVAGGKWFLSDILSFINGERPKRCIAANGAHALISPSGVFSLCCYFPSELKDVRSMRELMASNPDELRRTVAGCEGCVRYDQSSLLPLLSDPLLNIKWKRVFKSSNI